MTPENWALLWISLLWVSAGAFGLVAVYVLCGYVRSFRKSG